MEEDWVKTPAQYIITKKNATNRLLLLCCRKCVDNVLHSLATSNKITKTVDFEVDFDYEKIRQTDAEQYIAKKDSIKTPLFKLQRYKKNLIHNSSLFFFVLCYHNHRIIFCVQCCRNFFQSAII